MILPGISQVMVNGSGGLGICTRDPARPDRSPSRPGYVTVTHAAVFPPPPPQFVSVRGGGGNITVTLRDAEVVDGYHVGFSPSVALPITWGSTTSNEYTAPYSGGAPYIFARALRGGLVSAWAVWSGFTGDDNEWRQTYDDSALTGNGAYPGITTEVGAPVVYAPVTENPGTDIVAATYGSIDRITRAHFDTLFLGAHGGRYRYRLRLVEATFLYQCAMFASAGPGSDCYMMGIHCVGGSPVTYTLGLWLCDGAGALTLVAENTIPPGLIDYDLVHGANLFDLDLQGRSNGRYTGYCKGALVLDVTDTTIGWSAGTTQAGLLFNSESWVDHSFNGIYDFLTIYARDHSGEPEVIDPGEVVDTLREDLRTAPFAASHLVRFACRLPEDGPDTTLAGIYCGAPRLDTSSPAQLVVDQFATYGAGSASAVHTILRAGVNSTITAQHTFAPGTAMAPFILGTNAQGQLVTGLNAALLDGHTAAEFALAGSIATHGILSSAHSDTLVDTLVRGDLLVGNSTPKWSRLAKGSSGQMLKMGADDPGWATIGPADVGAAAATHSHAWGDIISGVPSSFTPSAHQLDSATYHPVSGLIAGQFLKALSGTTFGFAAHGLSAGDVGAMAAPSGTVNYLPLFSTGGHAIENSPFKKGDSGLVICNFSDAAKYTQIQTDSSGYCYVTPSAARFYFNGGGNNYIYVMNYNNPSGMQVTTGNSNYMVLNSVNQWYFSSTDFYINNNGGTLGIGRTSSINARVHQTTKDTVTNAVTYGLIIDHQISSGSIANNFGTGIKFTLQSSTTVDQNAGVIECAWVEKTDASRAATLVFKVYYATTAQEGLRITAETGGVKISLYAVTPVARQASTSAAVDYTGIDNAQAGSVYAKVADLNTLRAAYEDLRSKLALLGAVS